jgi:hypothetical protein
LTRIIRIAVNNLAGVPSIVYGVFGLGFFVYFVGGAIDQAVLPEALPAPTFGTPGLLWASLTLALLTVPVVIVSTEEGLSRIPRSIREGILALGATKAETLWRTVLPMASPAMMTGLILAVARAAGEVAPLMLVGVVKLAPALPLDGNLPFLHLDRKFMHLGFHIYRRRLPEPQRRGGAPAGLRHFAAAGAGHRRAQPGRHHHSQPAARKVQCRWKPDRDIETMQGQPGKEGSTPTHGVDIKSALRKDDGVQERPAEPRDCLEVKGLNLFYGQKQALFDVNMTIPERASRPSSVRRAAASRRCCAASTA